MKATNIIWDTDGDMEILSTLPTEIEIPADLQAIAEEKQETRLNWGMLKLRTNIKGEHNKH